MSRTLVSLLIFSIFIILFSCSFENDEEYFPRKQATWFLTGDNQLGYLETNNWKIPYPNLKVYDATLQAPELLLATGTQIEQLNLQSLNLKTILYTNAHKIAVGEKYIVVGDTINERLQFYDKNNLTKPAYIPEQTLNVKKIHYHSGKFYIWSDTFNIWVWDETALTIRAQYTLSNPIISLAQDRYFDLRIISGSNSTNQFYESILLYNGDLLAQKEKVIPYRSVLYSPYLRRQFEIEYLADIKQKLNFQLESTSLLFPKDSVTNFFFDFRNSDLYYLKKDTLHITQLNTQQKSYLPFMSSIKELFFYYNPSK